MDVVRYGSFNPCISVARRRIMVSKVDGISLYEQLDRGDTRIPINVSQW
jgi:hypothetical protein